MGCCGCAVARIGGQFAGWIRWKGIHREFDVTPAELEAALKREFGQKNRTSAGMTHSFSANWLEDGDAFNVAPTTPKDDRTSQFQKSSRMATLEGVLREINARTSMFNNGIKFTKQDVLDQINPLVLEAISTFNATNRVPQEPIEAREALEWRQACDDAYTDGMIARKCGIGPGDHGLKLDTEYSRALAQAFGLGWQVADEAAALDDLKEAARMHLKFNDSGTRDALRRALENIPGSKS